MIARRLRRSAQGADGSITVRTCRPIGDLAIGIGDTIVADDIARVGGSGGAPMIGGELAPV